MKINTFLIDPEKMIRGINGKVEESFPEKGEDCTGIKVTDIFGVDKHNDFIIISRETWKRIEIFMAMLSDVEMTISEEKIEGIFGGRSC
jgi:hypothetical protein